MGSQVRWIYRFITTRPVKLKVYIVATSIVAHIQIKVSGIFHIDFPVGFVICL